MSTRSRRFTEPRPFGNSSHPPAPSMINFDGRICQRSGKIPTPGLSSRRPSLRRNQEPGVFPVKPTTPAATAAVSYGSRLVACG